MTDGRVVALVNAYGKRTLAEWLVQEQRERERFEAALREIARWDSYRTLGYEGPKAVASAALDDTSVAAPRMLVSPDGEE